MYDEQQGPPQGGRHGSQQGEHAPTEWIGSGDPPHDGPGCDAETGSGGAQPDEAIPAGALGYVRVDLDPSAEQKINALRLLRSVPASRPGSPATPTT